jgi:hypothetical protein
MASPRTVVTLRTRVAQVPPRIGELMASQSGATVYRLIGVTCLRIAGEAGCRYRLTCLRLLRAEVPAGEEVLPWRLAAPKPPAPRSELPAPANAMSANPIRERVVKTSLEVRVGPDFGPALRRRAVRDRRGRLLREPDVEVEDAADPRNPHRRHRRAYRIDPVDRLRQAGTIGPREADAAQELRLHLERIAPPLSGDLLRIGSSSSSCETILDQHVRAATKLREASETVGEQLWPVVLWVCLGGSVRGYAEQWRMRPVSASLLVANGMVRLAEHFYGRAA